MDNLTVVKTKLGSLHWYTKKYQNIKMINVTVTSCAITRVKVCLCLGETATWFREDHGLG